MTLPSPTVALPTTIVLTGFMGTGKTTTARLLAQRLGYDLVDTDQVIEERHGTITDIFARSGEDGFRAIERAVAAELADRPQLVVSTGGRTMLDPATISTLGRSARCFCLTASADTIVERVVGDRSGPVRPLLAVDDPAARVRELLAQRAERYRLFPSVSTEDRSPSEVAERLVELIDRPPTMITTDGGLAMIGVAIATSIPALFGFDRPPTVLADPTDERAVALTHFLADRSYAPNRPVAGSGPVVIVGSAPIAASRIRPDDKRTVVRWPLRLDQLPPARSTGTDAVHLLVDVGVIGNGAPAGDDRRFDSLIEMAIEELTTSGTA